MQSGTIQDVINWQFHKYDSNNKLVIVFNSAFNPLDDVWRVDFFKLTKANICSVLYFRDLRKNRNVEGMCDWFYQDYVTQIVDHISTIAENNNLIIEMMTGLSMGGFAALLFSSFFTGIKVASFMPQTNLKKDFYKFCAEEHNINMKPQPKFNHHDEILDNRHLKTEINIHNTYFIMYSGKNEFDKLNIQQLTGKTKYSNVNLIELPTTKHLYWLDETVYDVDFMMQVIYLLMALKNT